MTYSLKFDPWSEDGDQTSLVRFVLLYQAFLGTADNPNRSKGLEETRQAIKILDAMAAISSVQNPGAPTENRLLKPEGGTIEFDEAGFQLLKRSVEAYVGQVPFAMAKVAMDIKDFVDAAASK